MTRTILSVATLAISWSLLGACGNSDDDEKGNGGVGSGDGDDTSDIDLGDGQGGAGSGFTLTPGPIDSDDLDRLRESACTGWSFEPELQPSVLQLIIDVSGSMDQPPPGGGNGTKWTITRDALRDTVETLPGTISLGAVYFPNMGTEVNCNGGTQPCDPGPAVDPDQCVNHNTTLDVGILAGDDSEQRTAFYDSLDDANTGGGTPTHDAYNLAKNELDASDAIGQRFLLLITDGQPTFLQGCSGSGYTQQPVDEAPVIQAIQDAAADGVRTFVIGSPGSEENQSTGADARPWLSQAAIEGGTAPEGCDENGPNYCHFDMSQESDFSAALRQALASIIGQITSCTISVPEAPDGQSVDTSAVNVVLTPAGDTAEVVGRNTDTDCEDGWNYGDNNQSISLCENTCLRLRENTSSGIELLFGCETVDEVVQ